MNLKCKLNIKLLLFILVAIDLMRILLKTMDEVFFLNGLIMDFWNDGTMFAKIVDSNIMV
jgi:hypothetical protein